MKHTPWILDPHGNIYDSEGKPIATIHNLQYKNTLVAAPDMLEALRGWAELYAMRPLDSGADIQQILERCWHKTEDALIKATGDTIGELEGEDE